ncbi:SAM pointed domain-containing Ets transcription factor isoform X1 [Piliocolobus tephrosceles]|nr:SAM pointed domain-containing Ets transcription factor isoform X1 [Piliocolobus tephrosceles]
MNSPLKVLMLFSRINASPPQAMRVLRQELPGASHGQSIENAHPHLTLEKTETQTGDTAASPNSSGMGSASPGLSSVSPGHLLLPPDTVSRTGLEKVAAGAVGLERRDWSPSPPATPEQGLSAFYLSYFDMLYSEDSSWAAKAPGASSREEPPEEPEQCPVIDSQAPGGSLDLVPGGLTLEEHSLEQVQSMVVGEVLKDIETACKLLNITADPVDWSPGNVQKWLLWTEHQYRLPPVGKAFQELAGKELCAMSEEQFRQRSPLGGDVLHAHLDIWKSAAWMKERTSPGAIHYCASTSEESWTDSEVDSSCSGQPIHLWQFLKELLLKPHSYGRFIRWLNKEKGIFKIEDSAQVARLWGIRKNRPAMNYDKLSRSIRQYYKKGIIRKPDISQRLVYQFVHPI